MTDVQIVQAMVRYGGRFASKLGDAFYAADYKNQARLRAAFPELWEEYREVAELRAKMLAEAEAR